MKTKNFKRVLTLVLALAMLFALSMSVFATGSVTLYYTVPDNTGTPVTTYVGTYNLDANNITVYDILSQLNTTWSMEYDAASAFSPLYDISHVLYGKYNQKINYMQSYNGISSAGYTPVAGALDEDNYYIPTQTVDSILTSANTELSAYGGLRLWQGNGYGIAGDGHHMIYIGWDWEFKVNGNKPGVPTSIPGYDGFFAYAMRESLLGNGDRIDINYVYSFFVFDTQ